MMVELAVAEMSLCVAAVAAEGGGRKSVDVCCYRMDYTRVPHEEIGILVAAGA